MAIIVSFVLYDPLDTFTMTAPNGSAIWLNENGIAWGSDVEKKYINSANASTTQWIDVEDGN